MLSYDRYDKMSQALNKTGRPILYSLCNWGEDQPWLFASTIANSWRISGDITNSFNRKDVRCPCQSMVDGACNTQGFHCSVATILDYAAPLGQKAAPGGWNDLDMLEIGNPAGQGMTKDEYITHFTMWSMAKSPLIMGNVLQNLTNENRAILTNEHVIAINQDEGGSPAIRLQDGKHQLWLSTLSNDSYALAAVNLDSEPWSFTPNLRDVFVDNVKELVQNTKWKAYDLWANVDFKNPPKKPGQRALKALKGGKHFHVTLPKVTLQSHQTKAWRLEPAKGN